MRWLLIGLAVFGAHVTAWAYPDAYPPFPSAKPSPWPTLEAVLTVKQGGQVNFPEDGVSIEVVPGEHDAQDPSYRPHPTRVWLNGNLVFDTSTAHPDFFPPAYAGQLVYYVDLTGDGRRDVLIYSNYGGNGLGAVIDLVDLLIRDDDGFQRMTFEAYAGSPEDFVDVNGDGRYEMLWVNYYSEGSHSYWVYRIVELGDKELRLRDELAEGFPKIIWFTEKLNDQSTQRLSQAERQDLIQQSTSRWIDEYQGDWKNE